MSATRYTAPPCPQCEASRAIPIFYGFEATTRLMDQFKAGVCWPGGALGRLAASDAPTWHCAACRYDWYAPFPGGTGEDPGTPVIIAGARDGLIGVGLERQYLYRRFGPEVAVQQQALVPGPGGPRDVLTVATPDGAEHDVWFDIGGFFGGGLSGESPAPPAPTDQPAAQATQIAASVVCRPGELAYDNLCYTVSGAGVPVGELAPGDAAGVAAAPVYLRLLVLLPTTPALSPASGLAVRAVQANGASGIAAEQRTGETGAVVLKLTPGRYWVYLPCAGAAAGSCDGAERLPDGTAVRAWREVAMNAGQWRAVALQLGALP